MNNKQTQTFRLKTKIIHLSFMCLGFGCSGSAPAVSQVQECSTCLFILRPRGNGSFYLWCNDVMAKVQERGAEAHTALWFQAQEIHDQFFTFHSSHQAKASGMRKYTPCMGNPPKGREWRRSVNKEHNLPQQTWAEFSKTRGLSVNVTLRWDEILNTLLYTQSSNLHFFK